LRLEVTPPDPYAGSVTGQATIASGHLVGLERLWCQPRIADPTQERRALLPFSQGAQSLQAAVQMRPLAPGREAAEHGRIRTEGLVRTEQSKPVAAPMVRRS
jgi:hypothetical protein